MCLALVRGIAIEVGIQVVRVRSVRVVSSGKDKQGNVKIGL